MPRLIDHDQRERTIAEAAWLVLARDGLLAMSVRNVSAQAGLATASLRRSFPSQGALRAYCLDLCAERIAARMQSIDPGLPARDYLEANLWQLLPFDTQRRLELDVQLTLGTLVGTDPLVAASFRRAHDRLREWIHDAVTHLAASDPRYRHLTTDLALHAGTLYALVDGLALHLWHDDDATEPATVQATQTLIRRHLDSLIV